MSKGTLAGIIKQWCTPVKKRNERPSRSKLLNLVERSPNSLEAKIAANPYAKMLASPLRHCTFHHRFFPSKLLLRYAQGWHQPTKLLWAYPTMKKSNGKGIYVNLSKKVLEIFGRGGYRAAFRGSTTYRSDMLNHIENVLFKESLQQFSKHPLNTLHDLTSSSPSIWSTNELSPMGYQCIIVLDPNRTSSITSHEFNHQIYNSATDTTHHNIPCYYMHRFWSIQDIQSLLPDQSTPIVLGLPRNLDTVDLAIALWRCRKFISSSF